MIEGNLKRKRIPLKWPARRVAFVFEHGSSGDQRFQPLIAQAMQEYLAADPHGEAVEFNASNGMRITIETEHE